MVAKPESRVKEFCPEIPAVRGGARKVPADVRLCAFLAGLALHKAAVRTG